MSSGVLLPAGPPADALVLKGVSLAYDGKPVIEGLDGAIPQGALLALVGPNGAGKSTLLKALAGLLRPSVGSIDRVAAQGQVAYLPQHGAVDQAFPMSVLDFVAMGLWREIGMWKPISHRQRQRAREALGKVDLGHMADQRIGTLSGGQSRRALFARASLQDAAQILLDEPFAGIDTATSTDLLGTVHAWHAQGRTVIAALHDLDQVRAHFPRTLLLARRVIGWGETADVLTAENLAVAFGKDVRRNGPADV